MLELILMVSHKKTATGKNNLFEKMAGLQRHPTDSPYSWTWQIIIAYFTTKSQFIRNDDRYVTNKTPEKVCHKMTPLGRGK
jgi:hypothetical protein